MRYRVLQKATTPPPPGLGKVVESGEFIGNCFLSSGLRFGLSQRWNLLEFLDYLIKWPIMEMQSIVKHRILQSMKRISPSSPPLTKCQIFPRVTERSPEILSNESSSLLNAVWTPLTARGKIHFYSYLAHDENLVSFYQYPSLPPAKDYLARHALLVFPR